MNLSTAQSALMTRLRRAHPAPQYLGPREDRTARVLQRAGLIAMTEMDDDLGLKYGLTGVGLTLADELRLGFMRSTFFPRNAPEAIWVGDECITGPFCVHCGNPSWLHGPEQHCPDRILQAAFPPPACRCHGLAPVTA